MQVMNCMANAVSKRTAIIVEQGRGIEICFSLVVLS